MSHGICDDCRARELAAPGGVVLVVSRERAAQADLLRSLFRGIPGTSIIVDRRRAERPRGTAPARAGSERRSGERRGRTALFVV